MNVIRGGIVVLVLIQTMLLSGVANAGTINNPDIIVNGQLEQYEPNANIANNWYTFSLSASGPVLASGIAEGGWSPLIIIYNLNLVEVERLYLNPNDTASLGAGAYYMQVSTQTSSGGGTFTFTSTFIKPECGAPSPDYTAGYNAGEKEGGGFIVIPIPTPAK